MRLLSSLCTIRSICSANVTGVSPIPGQLLPRALICQRLQCEPLAHVVELLHGEETPNDAVLVRELDSGSEAHCVRLGMVAEVESAC